MNEQMDNFLAQYAKFRAGAKWLADREVKGQDNAPHIRAFRALESWIDKVWSGMPEADKDTALLALAQKKAVSQEVLAEVLQAKELFNGKLVAIT